MDSQSRGVQVTGLSVETYIHPPLAAAGWVPSAEEATVLRGSAACVSAEPGTMKNWTAAPGIGAIARFLISVSSVKHLTGGCYASPRWANDQLQNGNTDFRFWGDLWLADGDAWRPTTGKHLRFVGRVSALTKRFFSVLRWPMFGFRDPRKVKQET